MKFIPKNPNGDFLISLAKKEDTPACAILLREAFAGEAEKFGLNDLPRHPSKIRSEELEADLKSGLLLYVCKRGSQIVGTLEIFNDTRRDVAELRMLAVDEEFRGIGIGRGLLDFAAYKAKSLKATKLSIGIIEEKVGQKNWWEKSGFQAMGVLKLDGMAFSICFMERQL